MTRQATNNSSSQSGPSIWTKGPKVDPHQCWNRFDNANENGSGMKWLRIALGRVGEMQMEYLILMQSILTAPIRQQASGSGQADTADTAQVASQFRKLFDRVCHTYVQHTSLLLTHSLKFMPSLSLFHVQCAGNGWLVFWEFYIARLETWKSSHVSDACGRITCRG